MKLISTVQSIKTYEGSDSTAACSKQYQVEVSIQLQVPAALTTKKTLLAQYLLNIGLSAPQRRP